MRNLRTACAVLAVLGAVGCGSNDNGNLNGDGGVPDSGVADSGVPDSGVPDSGVPDSGTPDAGPHLGALDVTVTGASDGGADVLVTGPAGFSQHLTGSAHLTNLTPGSYSFDAGDGRVFGDIVDTLAAPAVPKPVTVAANQTATAQVTYSAITGSGALWVPSDGQGDVGAYAPSVLRGDGGTPAATVRLVIPLPDGGLANPEVIAFDRAGWMWVGGFANEDAIYGFAPGQLGTSSDAGPSIAIRSADVLFDGGNSYRSIDGLEAMTFDSQGNLWVANSNGNTLVKFKPSQLQASGTPVPETLWTGGPLSGPDGIAFDKTGNLWIGQCSSQAALFEIPAAQLGSATLPDAAVALDTDGGSLGCTENIAFDSQDRLWATDCDGTDNIYAVGAANRSSSGMIVPDVFLSNVQDGGTPAFGCPTGIAFDNQGSAWVANYGIPGNIPTLSEITATQLSTSGDIQPSSWIQVPQLNYGGIAFYPAPANVPLYR